MTLALLTRCAATLPLLGSNQDSSDPEALSSGTLAPTHNRQQNDKSRQKPLESATERAVSDGKSHVLSHVWGIS